MMGREVRLPDDLVTSLAHVDATPITEYAYSLQKRLEEVGEQLRSQQTVVRQEGSDDPPLYMRGDLVWLRSYYRKKGVNPKLSAKYVGPYIIQEALPFHTYRVEKDGKTSIQHEARIRLYVEGSNNKRPELSENNHPEVPLPTSRLRRRDDGAPPSSRLTLPVALPRTLCKAQRPAATIDHPSSPTGPMSGSTQQQNRTSNEAGADEPEMDQVESDQAERPPPPSARPRISPAAPPAPPPRRSARLLEKSKASREVNNVL